MANLFLRISDASTASKNHLPHAFTVINQKRKYKSTGGGGESRRLGGERGESRFFCVSVFFSSSPEHLVHQPHFPESKKQKTNPRENTKDEVQGTALMRCSSGYFHVQPYLLASLLSSSLASITPWLIKTQILSMEGRL